jgi:hypothetical protein
MSADEFKSKPDSSIRSLACETYPGYEWVATLSGSDWDAIGYVGKLLADHGLDGYCPGTSVFAGFLARSEHAAEARRLISSDPWLRRRYGFVENETGSHPFHELDRNA